MLLLPVAGGIVASLYGGDEEPVYEAQATLLVQERRGGFSPGSDIGLSQQLASTYVKLIRSTPFLSKVLEENELPLGVDTLKGMITATAGSSPPTVEIVARSTDPALAASAADVVTREFIDYVIERRLGEIARLQAAATAQGIGNVQDLVAQQFTMIDSLALLEPVGGASVIAPRTRQNFLLGGIVGAMVATDAVLLLSSLSDTVRNPEEISRRFGVTPLGAIFKWPSNEVEEQEIIVWKAPLSTYSESFRQIRANLQFATANQPGRVYLVTSPGPGDGKSTIICNLAITLAQTGKQVVILDADLRRPSIHTRFASGAREPGLSNFL